MQSSDATPGTASASGMPWLRFDRAVSVGLVHPMLQLFRRGRQTRLPILMYHGITKDSGTRHPYFETNTSPELFALHMKFLHENGYRSISLDEAVKAISQPQNRKRSVVITFDDGYQDFYTDAFPILETYGFGATMFITSGRTSDRHACLGSKEFMTWEQIRYIHAHGIKIGSHTVSHPQLCDLPTLSVASEIGNSKQTIEDKLGCAVESFSYPFAFPEHNQGFIRIIKDLLQTHGYKNGVCTTIGTASREHDVFFLPRLPANSHDDVSFYRAKLEGSYDWLHLLQRLYKRFLKRRRTTTIESEPETSLLNQL